MPTKSKTATKSKKTVTVAELEAAVNKRWPGAMKRASDPSFVIQRIPCGVLSIDWLLGGGFPRGRYVEIYGSSDVGKTSTCYRLIANAQKMGLRCAFGNVEGKFDPRFAKHCGDDLANLHMIEQLEHGNQVVDEIEAALRSNQFDLIVMDSIAALLPQPEQESSMSDGSYGTEQAKLMSKALRKLTVANRTTCLVFINQVRENVGVVFGNRTVTSGGRAMGHYAGVRLEMVRTETIKRKQRHVKPNGEPEIKELPVGHRVLVRVAKEQTGGAREGDTSTFVFSYETSSIDDTEDLIYVGLQTGLVFKRGDAWMVKGYEEEKQPNRQAFHRWLKRNIAVAEELYDQICDAEVAEGEDEDG